jgi:hypothetical protein
MCTTASPLSVTGDDNRVERPAADADPFFSRFTFESSASIPAAPNAIAEALRRKPSVAAERSVDCHWKYQRNPVAQVERTARVGHPESATGSRRSNRGDL